MVLAGRREAEPLAVAGLVAAAGGEAIPIPTDVSDATAVEALVGGTADRSGRLDAAFNNAGSVGRMKPIVRPHVPGNGEAIGRG